MSSFNTFAAGSMMTLFFIGLAIEVRDCARQEPIENEARWEGHATLCAAYCREIDSVVLEIEWDAVREIPTCHCGPEWVDPE